MATPPEFFGVPYGPEPPRLTVAQMDILARGLKAELRLLMAQGVDEPTGWAQWADTRRVGTLGGAILSYRTGSLLDAFVLEEMSIQQVCWAFRAPVQDVVAILTDAVALYERSVAVERMGS